MADIKTLKIFNTVARQGSFQAAADQMGTSISSISLKMRGLEEFAGCLLFDRTRKPPPLTDQGHIFLKKAEQVLAVWAELEGANASDGLSDKLRIGAVHTTMSSFMPDALAAIKTHFPQLDVTIKLGLSHELETDIIAGRLDAAVVSLPDEHDGSIAELNYLPITSDQLMLIKPANQDGDDAVTLLTEHAVVRFNPDARVGRQIDDAFNLWGIPAAVGASSMEVDSLESVIALVGAGLGVSVIPLMKNATLPENITALPLPNDIHRQLVLAIPRVGTQVVNAQQFASLMRGVL